MAVLCLVMLAFATPLLASPARAYGEHVFQASPVVGPGDPFYSVYGSATLAQSISVTQGYVLTNVTLRVRNDGGAMNALLVSIHPDDPVRHVPVMSTQLASTSWVTPNNKSAPVNWSFPFNPAPVLQAGSVYWIVARNGAPQGPPTNGYEWHESDADSYPNGSAFVLDTSSGIWTGLPYDMYFVTYGREWASNVSLALTASRTEAQPADPVTFTVAFNNTGGQAAAWAWINLTLPSEFVNLSLSFPGIQPVSAAAFPNLSFQNVGNGPHSFRVASQVAVGTAPGTVLVTRAALDFENATGVVLRGKQANASLTVGLVTKQLYLGSTSVATKLLTTVTPTAATPASSTLPPGAPQPIQFLLEPLLARPFLAMNVSASLWVSTQKAPPQTYRLNVSLLDNGSPVASLNPSFTLSAAGYQKLILSFGAVGHTFAVGHQIGLSLWSFGGGGGSTDNLLLRYNGTAYRSQVDVFTSTYVAVDDLSLQDPVSNATVWSPLDPIVVLANVSDPFGASRIGGAWVNITSPNGTLVASNAMSILRTDTSSLPAWTLFNYTLSPPLATGKYRVDVTAKEDNGVLDLASDCAEVAEPVFTWADTTSLGRAQAGGAFAYYLYYNNSGTGSAGSVWINETLPAEVIYAGSSLPYTSFVGNVYSWALSDVPIGNSRLEIDVTVRSSSTVPAWIRDNATLTYTDASGHVEPSLYASAVVFLNGPVLSVSLTTSPAAGIHANETVTYTLSFQNSGADSGSVWANDTLPLGFAFLSDTSATIGATMSQVGSELHYDLPQILAGSNVSFQITARAGSGLTRNASYPDLLDVEYASTNGYLMPPETRIAALVALAPYISDADVSFLVSRTCPGGIVPTVAHVVNAGNEPASRVWVNLTFDSLLVVLNATTGYTGGPGFLVFELSDVPVGTTSIYLNLTVSAAARDGFILTMKGGVEGKDGFGNPLPSLAILRTLVLVTSPAYDLSVTPSMPVLEAGTVSPLTVTMSNTGSANASALWLNITLPGTLEYLNDTSGVTPSLAGMVFTYRWSSPSPVLESHASTAFTLNLRARAATANGTSADLGFQLDYRETNSIPRPGLNLTVRATIVAPALVLRVETSSVNLVGGGTFNYTLRIANLGSTVARTVSVVDDLNPALSVVSFASSVPGVGGQQLAWNFTDLAPGRSETINLTVRVAGGIPAGTDISNSIVAVYTNSVGTVLASIRSSPVTISVVQDFTALGWAAGIAAVLGLAAAVFLLRRDHVDIEEVFLVYRDGVLISHLSKTMLHEKDEDVLSGMLTAVQEFVREAFQYGEHRDLQQLDFGEYRILIERGKFVYLAVVYSGEESSALRKKVRNVIQLIETQFRTVLEKWDGDMDEVVGTGDLIKGSLLGNGNQKHTPQTVPEYE